MNKATVDIIKDLVKLLEFTEPILSCSVLDGEVFIVVCSTHGVVDKGTIEIGGVPTKVLRVINGNTFVISGTSCPLETEVFIPKPNYFHGTVKATDSELNQIEDSRKITTLVYLFEVLQEVKTRNPEATIGRTVDLVMFFLEDDFVGGDLTEDRYIKYINAMNRLAEDFVDLLETSNIIGSIEEQNYVTIPHAKAGFYDRLGHVKNLFSKNNFSGVELRITLPILKGGCIECK